MKRETIQALAGSALAALAVLATPAMAGDPPRSLSVDWSHADIQKFVDEQKSGAKASVLPEDEGRLAKLKLPVVGFDKVPSLLNNSLGVAAAEGPARSLVMDENEPVWYHITERYDGITISVDADLRLQEELPPSAKVFGRIPLPDDSVKVQVIDGTSEPGLEGAIAEYTVYRYPNIPYRVTIECEKRTRDYCRNAGSIAKDSAFLKLISARPPQ